MDPLRPIRTLRIYDLEIRLKKNKICKAKKRPEPKALGRLKIDKELPKNFQMSMITYKFPGVLKSS